MARMPLAALLMALTTVAAPATAAGTAESVIQTIQEGLATYYARAFEGRRTASGDIFRHAELTAAHPSHPFGTVVRVTNLKKNRSVIVRITDRGPSPLHQRRGTIIDLTKSAAAELGMMAAGRVPVTLEVLEWGASAGARAHPRWAPSKTAQPHAEKPESLQAPLSES
jgi:rare lipoprotein A